MTRAMTNTGPPALCVRYIDVIEMISHRGTRSATMMLSVPDIRAELKRKTWGSSMYLVLSFVPQRSVSAIRAGHHSSLSRNWTREPILCWRRAVRDRISKDGLFFSASNYGLHARPDLPTLELARGKRTRICSISLPMGPLSSVGSCRAIKSPWAAAERKIVDSDRTSGLLPSTQFVRL